MSCAVSASFGTSLVILFPFFSYIDTHTHIYTHPTMVHIILQSVSAFF